MHLVLICRRDPYLPILTLRDKRLLAKIRTQDLRFNEMEIRTILTQMLETQVDSSTTAALAEKTDWIYKSGRQRQPQEFHPSEGRGDHYFR
jgi:ATP/maltotriose-dependent transcriptional regulator MalT